MQAELSRPPPQNGGPVTQEDEEVTYVYIDLADLRGELPPPGSQITLQARTQLSAACEGMQDWFADAHNTLQSLDTEQPVMVFRDGAMFQGSYSKTVGTMLMVQVSSGAAASATAGADPKQQAGQPLAFTDTSLKIGLD